MLNNGAPLRLPWIERVSAVVEAWLPGQEGARAVAEVLLGMSNPCGKLPLTFPRRLEDNPSYLYYSNGRDAHYGEGVFVGYRYYEKKKIEPLFPFGHGLSYTTFEYSNLRAPDEVLAGQPIHVSLDVTNTGTMPGRETVQLYVGDEVTQDVVRPVKELKGFHKVELAPGESQIVRFTLNTHDLAYYDVHRRAWIDDARKVSAVRGQLRGGHSRDALVQLDRTGRRARTGRAVDLRGRPLIWQPT